MAKFADITIRHERRLCTVNGKLGYFHCWEHYSAESGSFVRAIVEFSEGIGYASPADIKFHDDEHEWLSEMTKHLDEKSKEALNEN